jgi:hypothetical protein
MKWGQLAVLDEDLTGCLLSCSYDKVTHDEEHYVTKGLGALPRLLKRAAA